MSGKRVLYDRPEKIDELVVDDYTVAQLRWLEREIVMTPSEVVAIAIDRMYQSEGGPTRPLHISFSLQPNFGLDQ